MSQSKELESYMKSLFFGEIKEELIFPFPVMQPEVSETVSMVLDSIHRFEKEKVNSAQWDEKGEMPIEIVKNLSELGLMGVAVEEQYGGLGLPQNGYSRVMQEVARMDGSIATTVMAHQSIGYKAIMLFGTNEQKERFLPRLASGELIACYCLTEPGSGSDAASIKTRAELSSDGSHYVLNGNKIWITNGEIANFMTIFAKTTVEDKGEKKEKVTCFVLEVPEGGLQGLQVGSSEDKLGIRASWTNAVHFENVKIPKENLVGEPGKGFKVAMGVLNHGRLGLASGCIGGAKACLEASILHANERSQFQKKLREYGMIKEKISRMTINTYAAQSMVFVTTHLIDRGNVDYSIESAICKIFASETLWEAVDENLQIWAGSGYMKEYPYERWLRDARINRIFEGTNEILRAFIALSGMQGPGQLLAGLAEAIRYPLKGLGQVSDFALRRIRRNFFGESITRSHPQLKNLASRIEEYTVEFASQVEVLLRRHGKEIYLQQLAQKRIAEIAIDLYAMSCILSRVSYKLTQAKTEQELEQVKLDQSIAESFAMRANRRIRGNLRAMNRNDAEQVHMIADRLFDHGAYPYDVIRER